MAVLPVARRTVLDVRPVWRANRYLSPVSVTLWIVGLVAPIVGVIVLFAPAAGSG
ncbi:hypothetical protein [Pseudoxanthomonas wuyuanensis]|uniref:hypothetical protein n=1 Tax=Pseudoxanthomonas wuyuanensis TaxID=1073196 RepID=UPI001389C93B|nr:hypothetical protein [Pseudoxanthomonas wuyuanensis]